MPIICIFYGIKIAMYYDDHNPPHIHAIYGEHEATYQIENQKKIEGMLPPRAEKMISE